MAKGRKKSHRPKFSQNGVRIISLIPFLSLSHSILFYFIVASFDAYFPEFAEEIRKAYTRIVKYFSKTLRHFDDSKGFIRPGARTPPFDELFLENN